MKATSIFRLAAGGIVLLVICMLLPGSPALSDGRGPDVQVQTEYNVGPVQTDASRAIDMAERVMMQNQQMAAAQLARIEAKLDKLTERIISVDNRLAGIEQHLGIVPLPAPAAGSGPGGPQPGATKPAKPAK
jgi:hypothetical protein